MATSGSYIRGNHIYNPLDNADRLATAAFAMRQQDIQFIKMPQNVAGYMIDTTGLATQTTGWANYVV